MTSLVIGAVGAGLIAAGVAAGWRQCRAASCPGHGHVARRLVWACLMAGIVGLLAAVAVYWANREAEGYAINRIFSAVATGLKNWIGIKEPPSPPPYNPLALSRDGAEYVIDRLVDMGFLKFVAESRRSEVRAQLIEAAQKRRLDSDWDDDEISADRRSYPARSADLAKGGIGKAILLMKDVLKTEGLTLESVRDDFGDERYQVVINGTPHLIYEVGGETTRENQAESRKRLLTIMNQLLEQAGSTEQLYGLNRGTDGRVILLTPEMRYYLRSISDMFDYLWVPYSAEEIEKRQKERAGGSS
jgi:hypothetical protein